jgi:hypothetical protein
MLLRHFCSFLLAAAAATATAASASLSIRPPAKDVAPAKTTEKTAVTATDDSEAQEGSPTHARTPRHVGAAGALAAVAGIPFFGQLLKSIRQTHEAKVEQRAILGDATGEWGKKKEKGKRKDIQTKIKEKRKNRKTKGKKR